MELEDYMNYAVRVSGNGRDGFVARLKGIPGALTGAATRGEALRLTRALVTDWAAGCFRAGEEMPAGARPGPGDDVVRIPSDAAAKIMVRNAMLRKGVTVSAAAARMGMPASQLSRTLRLCTSTRLSILMRICEAAGVPLKLAIG